MKRSLSAAVGFATVMLLLHTEWSRVEAQTSQPLKPILGTAFSPPHSPHPTLQDCDQYFQQAAVMGGHTLLIADWTHLPSNQDVSNLITLAHNSGLKFHLFFAPPLKFSNTMPSTPVIGGSTSFGNAQVRLAFLAQSLAYAALKPDVLGLGAEVSFLAVADPFEFAQYVSLVKTTYSIIKSIYHNLIITISFQYDVMSFDFSQLQFLQLVQLNDAVDVFSFTTYPKAIFGSAANVPGNYYSSLADRMRNLRLTKPVGFSEIGWDTSGPGQDIEQDNYLRRLPALMTGLAPRFLSLAMMNDANNYFQPPYAAFNFVGIRTNDGTPKPAWATVTTLSWPPNGTK